MMASLGERELKLLLSEPTAASLRERLMQQDLEFAAVVGCEPAQLPALAGIESDEALRAELRRRSQRRHREALSQRLADGHQRSREAASRIGTSARWHEGVCHLDPELLLGDLLRASEPFVSFGVAGRQVVVALAALRRLRTMASRLSGLHAWIDTQALHLRWSGGRGGLDLRTRRPVLSSDGVLRVVIPEQETALPSPDSAHGEPPGPASATESERATRHPRQRPTWLGRVLDDVLATLSP